MNDRAMIRRREGPPHATRRASVRVAFAAALAAAGGIASPGAARAMPPAAEVLYEDGKAALKAGDLDRALGRFRESMAQVALEADGERDVWQMLLAIALVWERKGEPGNAVETYRRFLDRSERFSTALDEKWRQRRKLAETSVADLAERLRKTHGFVTVVTEPPGAAVFLLGRRAGADGDAVSPFGAYLPAGAALVRAELEGRAPAESTVDVVAGSLHPVSLKLAPVASPVAERPAGDPGAPPDTESAADAGMIRDESRLPPRPASRVFPWVLVGAGVASAGVGAVFTIRGIEAREEGDRLAAGPDPPTKSEWEAAKAKKDDAELLSWIFYGGAVALAAGGTSWLVFAPAPGGARVAVGGRF